MTQFRRWKSRFHSRMVTLGAPLLIAPFLTACFEATSPDDAPSEPLALTFTATPDAETIYRSGIISFSQTSGLDLNCQIDDQPVEPCAGGYEFNSLALGSHRIRVSSAQDSSDFEEFSWQIIAATRPDNTDCVPPEAPPSEDGIEAIEYFGGEQIGNLIAAKQDPNDDDHWFLAIKSGRILRVDNRDDAYSGELEVLDITDRVAFGNGFGLELGLFDVELAPNFNGSGHFYVSYAVNNNIPNGTSRISRFFFDGANPVDASTEQIIFELTQPYDNHNGGTIAFGQDGLLYFSMGDGGEWFDDRVDAQDPENLFGKVLRFDVSDTSSPGYTVPDGPFGNEVFALGFRNPWRFTFDSLNGDLWLGDVGESAWEEVNFVEAGNNYGWPIMEGADCFAGGPPTCDTTGYVTPVVSKVWGNSGDGEGVSIIGGYVYRGSAIPALYGTYLFSDWLDNRIWALRYHPDTNEPYKEAISNLGGGGLLSFAEDNQGELYLISNELRKIVPQTEQPGPGNFPVDLADTGCVSLTDSREPGSGLIEFDIASPLWSDGVAKRRWMALPQGEGIDLTDDGQFLFPSGTVLMKQFIHNEQPIETRLLVKQEDSQWAGYSWEFDGMNATWVEGGATKEVDGITWQFPSSSQCLQCHTSVANRSLGPEVMQMKGHQDQWLILRDMEPSIFVDGIDLAALGDPLPSLPDPIVNDSDVSLQDRARSYLHSNCSHCHQPGGSARSPMDLRYQTAFANQFLCNQEPDNSDLGLGQDARLLVPGNAELSILVNRINRRDQFQMPPLGTHSIDGTAVTVITDWVNQMADCPS